jgi:hypothetical protein
MLTFQTVLTTGLASCMATTSFAGTVFPEEEPNNTFADAQILPPLAYFQSNDFSGGIAPGDVDFFVFEVTVMTLVMIQIQGFTPANSFDPGSLVGFFDSSGAIIDSAAWNGGGPVILASHVSVPGTIGVAISGFEDFAFTGDHDRTFGYELGAYTASSPAAGALPLLALAGFMGRSRRR